MVDPMKDTASFPLVLDLVSPPTQVDADCLFTLAVALECDAPCDLSSVTYELHSGENLIGQGVLGPILRFDPDSPDYDPRNGPVEKRDQIFLSARAPKALGHFEWHIVIPAQSVGDIAIEATQIDFAATTSIHQTSLAVWDVPAPVQPGQKMRISIGAKCSAGCDLGGLSMRILNQGAGVATGTLSALHPQMEGLWCGEVELDAPITLGLAEFDVSFAPGDPRGLPHSAAQASFSTIVDAPPDHDVAVAIVDRETGAPVEEAHIRLGLQRVSTDMTGRVIIPAPRGEHRLFVWKAGFEIPEQMILVDQDLNITVQAKALPVKNPYDRWQG